MSKVNRHMIMAVSCLLILAVSVVAGNGHSRSSVQDDFAKSYFETDRGSEVPTRGYASKKETGIAIAVAVASDLGWISTSSKYTVHAHNLRGLWVIRFELEREVDHPRRRVVIEVSKRTGIIVAARQLAY
jgi:hypothetical protein